MKRQFKLLKGTPTFTVPDWNFGNILSENARNRRVSIWGKQANIMALAEKSNPFRMIRTDERGGRKILRAGKKGLFGLGRTTTRTGIAGFRAARKGIGEYREKQRQKKLSKGKLIASKSPTIYEEERGPTGLRENPIVYEEKTRKGD